MRSSCQWGACSYCENCATTNSSRSWPIWLMIAFITWNSNLVPLLEGLCSSNPLACRFESRVFGFLPESKWQPRDWQSRALTIWASFTLSRMSNTWTSPKMEMNKHLRSWFFARLVSIKSQTNRFLQSVLVAVTICGTRFEMSEQ